MTTREKGDRQISCVNICGRSWEKEIFENHCSLLQGLLQVWIYSLFIHRKWLIGYILKYDCSSLKLFCMTSCPKWLRIHLLPLMGVCSFFFFFFLNSTFSSLRSLGLSSMPQRIPLKLPNFSYSCFYCVWCTSFASSLLEIITLAPKVAVFLTSSRTRLCTGSFSLLEKKKKKAEWENESGFSSSLL